MKKVLAALMAGIFVVAMAGCGGPAQDEPAPAGNGDTEPATTPEAQPEEPAAPAEAPAETPDESAEAQPEAAEGGTGLTGTKWQMGDYVIEFQDESNVLVKGGQIATLMPDGAMGEYKVEDGKFSVNILGMTRSGTWDGEKLIVDGTEAVPQ